MVYFALLLTISIYSSKKKELELFLADKIAINIPPKYFDYTDVFSPDFAMKLPEYTSINNYEIKLEKVK